MWSSLNFINTLHHVFYWSCKILSSFIMFKIPGSSSSLCECQGSGKSAGCCLQLFSKKWLANYYSLLEYLQLPSLSSRHTQAQLTLIDNCINKLIYLCPDIFLSVCAPSRLSCFIIYWIYYLIMQYHSIILLNCILSL